MFWQRFRLIALAGAVAAAAAVPARAGDCCSPAPCCQTTYKVEYRQEAYTAYKWVCTPETRTRTCTVWKRVPETRTVTQCVCVTVPCVEERTVMQSYVTCKPVTHMVRKCVDRGHWECREVPCCRSWRERCHRHHRHGCGCEESCCESCCPSPTRTVRVWVPCKQWIECPVTCMQRCCECRPVTCKVTVCKHEIRQVQHQVTCWKCVPECRTEAYTCMVPHCVPYQATRCVAVCVPCPAPACCETTCCKPTCCPVSTCCNTRGEGCCHHHHHRARRCGCESRGCETCGHERCRRHWRHRGCCCD